ncbi:MAG: OmpH family outer membrane protein [Nitrospinae bacterium]|nr:OmpH family outer membrane protein [Nitrospinota bacterium]
MKNLIAVVLSVFFLFGTAYNSSAESLKIGYVDLQKALNQSSIGKTALEKLKKDIEKENSILKEREEDVKKLEEELTKQGFMMKESERERKTEEFRRKGRDLDRYKEDTKRDIMMREREMTARIVSELIKLAQKIGQEEGFTIIMEKGDTVLYAADNVDLTDKLVKRYDEQKKQ